MQIKNTVLVSLALQARFSNVEKRLHLEFCVDVPSKALQLLDTTVLESFHGVDGGRIGLPSSMFSHQCDRVLKCFVSHLKARDVSMGKILPNIRNNHGYSC
ncbi:hypothetical protein WI92_18515 [Burkholderia vietnamiensis]|nr:hypothetical protein WI92_18515 [Burkholderia vietnamiensis]